MFWDKKGDKNSLPDLPPAYTASSEATSEFPSDDEDSMHSLPSFPDSPMQKGFSQSAIKDAVAQPSSNDLEYLESRTPSSFKTVEMDDWTPQTPRVAPPVQTPPVQRLPPPPVQVQTPPISRKGPGKTGDIFVKIDKFNATRRSLRAIHEKMAEIDTVLKRIRETKLREEQELSAWEKEVTALKGKLHEVTQTIFETSE